MTPIVVDELTSDEFADFLADLLDAHGYNVQRSESIALQVGDEAVDWRFPAVVVAQKEGRRCVIVPRSALSASIPGYLLKYLDGTRRTDVGTQIYIACRDKAAHAYTEICAVYGLGVLGCSLSSHRMSEMLAPSSTDIARAFEEAISPLIARARRIKQERLDQIDEHQKNFNDRAKAANLKERREEFDRQRSRCVEWIEDIEARANDLLKSRSLEDLRELQRIVDEQDF